MCNVELEFGKLHLPGFTSPVMDNKTYLEKLCRKA
jgi:hypothetical protein